MKAPAQCKVRLLGLCFVLIFIWAMDGVSPGFPGCVTSAIAGLPSATAPGLATTVRMVRHYALTSANDFPQRDPESWRLLASNDGGTTWVVLDVRKGEFFSERHQRRVFDITNSTAFNMYRFQIDNVREANDAGAVQLSEIEPMGDSEDDFSPTPLFCDLIRAQGDNPPAETVFQAFDGRVDTKWLDQASQHPATRSSWIQWQYLDHTSLVITNLNQLLALRTRAREGFPIKVSGVFVGQTPGTNRPIIMDRTGFIEIASANQAPRLNPGQKVLLTGFSVWHDNEVQIQQAELAPLEPRAASRPESIEVGNTTAADGDLHWVEAEGQMQFPTLSGKQLEFELVENGQEIHVHVLHVNPSQSLPASGTHMRCSGLAEKTLNENGDQLSGILWIPSLDAISMLDRSVEATNLIAETGQQLSGNSDKSLLTDIISIRELTRSELTNGPYVKVRGVVTEPGGTCIQDGTGGIEIWPGNLNELHMPGLGSFVEVEGRAIVSSGHGVSGFGPAILASKVHYLGNGKLPAPVRAPWSLLSSGQMDAEWVEVHGVVRATDGSHLLLACEDAQLMATIVSAPVQAVNHLVDATIQVRGVSIAATDERGYMQGVRLLVPSLTFVEIQQAPVDPDSLRPRNISSLLQVRGMKELIHRVKINGVLTGFANNNYFIQDNTGSVRAIAKRDVTLSLPAGGWWSFWQRPKSNARSHSGTELKVGDQVEAVGFPETLDYAPVLTEATLRKVGGESALAAVKTTTAELATGNLDSTLVTLDGELLGSETYGAFSMLQIQSDQAVFQAFLPLNGKSAPSIAPNSRVKVVGICQMDPPMHKELGKSPSEFSLLLRDSSDLSLLEPPPWLNVRRALIAMATLTVILCGTFFWIRVLHQQVEIRTHQLKNEIVEHEKTESLLDRKTQLLLREVEEHKLTEASLAEKTGLLEREIKQRELIYAELEEKKSSLEFKIEERKRIQLEIEKIHKQLLTASRLAGMADVATNVLHNVGNVLNGVNVLATSLASFVKKSRAPGVSRLAELLQNHQFDLGPFFNEDENGKHVLKHMKRLGDHLIEEQSKLLDRVTSLTESIQHIKEIIAMQQNYAKVSGVCETVMLSEIVEDALKMCSESLDWQGITISRNYEEIPQVILDRHKVLQIFFNLIDNARHACEEGGRLDKHIAIRIGAKGTEQVQVEVTDNGAGISPEHLSHIFAQGFSTRKEGHGFGLHSCVLAAQEMGGLLQVKSAGRGHGAAFTLTLPFAPGKDGEHVPKTVKILTA